MSVVVPDACTLPSAQQPLRSAEFEALFADSACEIDQPDATHARLWLTGPAGLTAKVRNLTDHEAECCSFFTFTIDIAEPTADVLIRGPGSGVSDRGDLGDGESVLLHIRVPPQYTEVLTSLTAQARAAIVGRP